MVDTRDSKSCAERRGGSSPLQGKVILCNIKCSFYIQMSGFFLCAKRLNLSLLFLISYILYTKKKLMEVNILAFLATALFILIPTAFLIILYVKTESQAN